MIDLVRRSLPPGLRTVARRLRRQRRITRAARYWDRVHRRLPDDVSYWLSVPAVRAAVNQRVSGHPNVDYVEHFLRLLREAHPDPVARVLSVGCGTGELECRLVQSGAAAHVLGIDVSRDSIDAARVRATEGGLEVSVQFLEAEAGDWLRARPGERFGLIAFHGVLHHIEALEELLDLSARALEGGSPGVAFLYEYVGPSRHEWMADNGCADSELGYARSLFTRIPVESRRTPAVWPPLDVADPTEMIRAAEIDGLVRSRYEIVCYWPMYGNVVAPLANALKAPELERPDVARVIEEAVALESYLIDRELLRPLYACYVARPKRQL